MTEAAVSLCQRVRRSAVALTLACLLAVAPLAGCSTNPATGKSQLNMLGEGEEISLGEQAAPEFLQAYGGPIPHEGIRRYVSNIGQSLAAQSERPDLPWEFHVIDSSVINAFALPGGKVFMSRGLISKMNNEAQLAGVLGHEVGHVTAQHIGQQLTQQQLLATGLGVGMIIAGQSMENQQLLQVLGLGLQGGATVYMLSHSRGAENESDLLGIRYMTKLGYNPWGQVQVMEILAIASGDGGGPPEFLSTHPLPQSRIENLSNYISQHFPNANEPGYYHFYEDRFEQNVLQPLKTLPPAKHTGQDEAAAKAMRAQQLRQHRH